MVTTFLQKCLRCWDDKETFIKFLQPTYIYMQISSMLILEVQFINKLQTHSLTP